MRKFLTFIFLITAISTSYAQFGWYQVPANTGQDIRGVSMYNSQFGFAVGTSGILRKTTNGGLIWKVAPSGSNLDLYKITHLDSLRWFAVGQNGVISRTSNAGETWGAVSSGTTAALHNIHFVRVNGSPTGVGYITAVGGVVLKTLNFGLNWSSMSLATSNNLFFAEFIDNNYGFVGGKGVAFRTTNGGSNWLSISPSQFDDMSSAKFRDRNNGFIVGGATFSTDGVIYKTSNAGNNWTAFNPSSGALKSVIYLPNGNISVVGNNIILLSTNDGVNWVTQTSDTIDFFHDSYFIDNNTGFAVGSNGIVIRTTTGGVITNISTISTETPVSYKLYQNYPNPFNPSTKIKFEIPQSEFVKLKVFNTLGQEVKSLVNSDLSPGVYEFTLDASALSGGVYYYKLSTQNFSEVRKMVLMK